jgi:oxidase EvaA
VTTDKPTDIATLREAIAATAAQEPADPEPVVRWLEARRELLAFNAELIPLEKASGWQRNPETGAVEHQSGQFFAVEAVRTRAGAEREVSEWDQPIFTQPDGGILAILCGWHEGGIRFLLQAKAEPGNIGYLQISPTVQATHSNLRRAHRGTLPVLGELLLDDAPVTTIYSARHNEEGGRFWRKTNENRLLFADRIDEFAAPHGDRFYAASLAQIKALCLVDDVISPFVKTIIAPI